MDKFRAMWAADGLPGFQDLTFNTLMAGACPARCICMRECMARSSRGGAAARGLHAKPLVNRRFCHEAYLSPV